MPDPLDTVLEAYEQKQAARREREAALEIVAGLFRSGWPGNIQSIIRGMNLKLERYALELVATAPTFSASGSVYGAKLTVSARRSGTSLGSSLVLELLDTGRIGVAVITDQGRFVMNDYEARDIPTSEDTFPDVGIRTALADFVAYCLDRGGLV